MAGHSCPMPKQLDLQVQTVSDVSFGYGIRDDVIIAESDIFISYHAGEIHEKALFLHEKESRPHRCEDLVWYGSTGQDQIKGRK